MPTILLTRGLVATVDAIDFERLDALGRWHAQVKGRNSYARIDLFGQGSHRRVFMHSMITGWPMVDHRNGDGLDNRRQNLRPATYSQNSANRGMQSNNQSGFKGVTRTPWGRWKAQIRKDGRDFYLGVFAEPEVAARAYDVAALDLFGEFAWTNFVPEDSPA